MKIVFDAVPLARGDKSGVGYFTYNLIQSLSRHMPANFELIGHYFNFLGRNEINRLPEGPNIRYKVSRLVPGKVLGLARKMGFGLPYELFTHTKADVVLFPNYSLLPLALGGKRIVVIYDLSFIDCPEFVSDRNRVFLQRWVPISIDKADLIITISEFTKQRIVNAYSVPPEKIIIIPIPPILEPEADQGIFKRCSIGRNYLLFVGTIEPRKNILGLLEAYALLPKEFRNAYQLVLAGGKGWHDVKILKRITQLKSDGMQIIQTGYVSDEEKTALYQKASLCIQPSHYEGFGMPVLEAMAQNCPVICSDIDVLHEVAGEAAIYSDKDNPKAMADDIVLLLKDKFKREKLVALGRKRLDSFPKWENIADSFYDAVEKITQK